MVKSYNFNLNKFFRKIALKKQYMKRFANETMWLMGIKEQSYKNVNFDLLLRNQPLIKHKSLIRYIVNISFSHSNAALHITDFSGALKFGCSAGNLSFSGKKKKSKTPVLKAMLRVLIQKLKMLRNKSVALHLKNVGSKRSWIIRRLTKKLFVKAIRCFNAHPHNGCRKRKARRKKFKKRRVLQKEMAEWFKAADCKSVEVSHRRFKSCFLYFIYFRNMTQIGSVPALGAGSHVFKSHYFELFFRSAILNWKISILLSLYWKE